MCSDFKHGLNDVIEENHFPIPHPDHLFDELSPFNPYMNYGRSKMEMELAVRERANRIETAVAHRPAD